MEAMTKELIPRATIVKSLIERDGNYCQYPNCEKEFTTSNTPTIDHFWLPRSKGGSWDLDNLKLMCKRCNALKSDVIPNEDGSLPERPRSTTKERRAARAERPDLCQRCENGRSLGPQESCNVCGSGPMPHRFPRFAKAPIKDCDHSEFWCGWCSIGLIERKAAVIYLIEGPTDGD